jgi:phosphoglycerate dehydrogenase-like enzyme
MAHKVVVLDDYQGLSKPHYDRLDAEKFRVTYMPDTQPSYSTTSSSIGDQIVDRLKPFDVICTMRERTPFPADLIQRLPNLKLLLTTGNRNAAFDLAACKEWEIPVAGTSGKHSGRAAGVGVDSTTEHCVAMIMALARGLARDDHAVKTGGWQSGAAAGLSGRTLGVVGLGRLGVSVARIMHVAFGMRVVAWSTNLTQDAADDKARAAGIPVTNAGGQKTFRVVSRDELFSTADVVSIHLVLSSRSKGIITTDDLSKMKPSALFVNTSRGPLVVEKDLVETAKAGRIRGIALDVFDVEPLPKESEWRSCDWGRDGTSEVLLTPHMGYVEEAAMSGWYREQVENLERWAKGEPLEDIMV